MSTTTPTFNIDAIGQWSDPVEFEVTRERIQQYAAATNDPIAQHVAGEFASPVFAVVPAFGAAGAGGVEGDPAGADDDDPPRRAGLPLPRADRARARR